MKQISDSQANLIGFILALILISPIAYNVLGPKTQPTANIPSNTVENSAATKPANTTTPNKTRVEVKKSTKTTSSNQSIGITADQLKNNFNNLVSKTKDSKETKIKNLPVYQGKTQNTFEYELTSNDTLVGSIDKETNQLKSITLISSSFAKSDLATTRDIIKTIVKTSVQNITSEKADSISNELLTSKFNASQYNESAHYKNVEYSLSADENTGITFSIQY